MSLAFQALRSLRCIRTIKETLPPPHAGVTHLLIEVFSISVSAHRPSVIHAHFPSLTRLACGVVLDKSGRDLSEAMDVLRHIPKTCRRIALLPLLGEVAPETLQRALEGADPRMVIFQTPDPKNNDGDEAGEHNRWASARRRLGYIDYMSSEDDDLWAWAERAGNGGLSRVADWSSSLK